MKTIKVYKRIQKQLVLFEQTKIDVVRRRLRKVFVLHAHAKSVNRTQHETFKESLHTTKYIALLPLLINIWNRKFNALGELLQRSSS